LVSNVDYLLGKNIVVSALSGNLWEVSCGTGTHTLEFVGASRTARVNGRVFCGPLLVARHARLDHLAIAEEGGASDSTYMLISGTQEYNDFGGRASLPSREAILKSKIAYMKALNEADRILAEAKALAWRSPRQIEAERQSRAWAATLAEDRKRHYQLIDEYRYHCIREQNKPRPLSLIEELEAEGRQRELDRQRNVLAGSR
jgi:hypothetical protein